MGSQQRTESIARLKRVLSAFALTDPLVGYCQGMTDLAAPLLEVFDTDEEVFVCFSQLMRHVRGNFLAGMHKIREDISTVRDLLIKQDASLHRCGDDG